MEWRWSEDGVKLEWSGVHSKFTLGVELEWTWFEISELCTSWEKSLALRFMTFMMAFGIGSRTAWLLGPQAGTPGWLFPMRYTTQKSHIKFTPTPLPEWTWSEVHFTPTSLHLHSQSEDGVKISSLHLHSIFTPGVKMEWRYLHSIFTPIFTPSWEWGVGP